MLVDVKPILGNPGRGIYNSIVSTAEYLSKKTYVDSLKLGVYGHSFGGYGVNYLITHSDKFAAATSAAGRVNLISSYGSLRGLFGESQTERYEFGQYIIGATLWQNADLFINNSPVFKLPSNTNSIIDLSQ